ncbi:MAG: HTTM domain-containing protein [Pirellulaceae bacterium]
MNEFLSRFQCFATQYFALDVRSLAVLRIGMALIMLGQLAFYFPMANDFFGENGVLPAELHREALDHLGFESAWTLYSISDNMSFVAGLMLIHMVMAMWLLLGFFTRISTFTCLVLLWSLQMRNPLITTGGDVLLRCMLAWSVFLPLGKAFSIDSKIDGLHLRAPEPVVNFASAGLILQIVFMYFFAGIAKLNTSWLSGDAIQAALQLEMHVKPFGELVGRLPSFLLKLPTWFVLILELAIPLLVFPPRYVSFVRGMAAGLFMLLHLGIWLTMSIGIFSIAGMVAWLAFIPAQSWEPSHQDTQLNRQRTKQQFENSLLARILTFAMLVYMVLINMMNASPSFFASWGHRGLQSLGCGTMFIQEFKMFAQPPQWSPSFVYMGQSDTRNVDLFGKARRIQSSKSNYKQMFAQPWRRYHWNLLELDLNQKEPADPILEAMKFRLLQMHVKIWNDSNNDQIVVAKLICFQNPIRIRATDTRTKQERSWALWP